MGNDRNSPGPREQRNPGGGGPDMQPSNEIQGDRHTPGAQAGQLDGGVDGGEDGEGPGHGDDGNLGATGRDGQAANGNQGDANGTSPQNRAQHEPHGEERNNGHPRELPTRSDIPHIQLSLEFIKLLKNAKLDSVHSGLTASQIDALRNPEPVSEQDFDANLRFSMALFLASLNASEDTYKKTCKAVHDNVNGFELLSYEKLKTRLGKLSGVYPVSNDMCVNTCMAYTGPYNKLDHCPFCHEARFVDQHARRTFFTIPIGPQIQAQWCSPSGAGDMRYRARRTREVLATMRRNNGKIDEYDDFICGSDYLERVINGEINDDDTLLLFSIDGAQLYRMKQSDCWIYIWVILNLAPDKRYKVRHVLIAGCIPGPNAPQNMDSFLFPCLYHLAAIQNDGGLVVYDGQNSELFRTQLRLVFVTADCIAMAEITHWVGHHGRYSCRIFCGLPGRHKAGAPHYYISLLKPDNYSVRGSSHPDIDITNLPSGSNEEYLRLLTNVIQSHGPTQFTRRRCDNGLSSATIFLGLDLALPIPLCFTGDIMHLEGLNIPQFLIGLWRGGQGSGSLSVNCATTDSRDDWDWAVLADSGVWDAHGSEVADSTEYLPGCFERPPRDPSEKISSGYKATEFLAYLYGLCPGLLYEVLPHAYWRSFCKLVRGVRLLSQRTISADNLTLAHGLLMSFCIEFETLYCRRRADRLHFVRPCIHFLIHRATETFRVGPMALLAQWTMERTIGNLGAEIRHHQDPYANLTQRALLRAQCGAFYAMAPGFISEKSALAQTAWDLQDGYALLQKRDDTSYLLDQDESTALRDFLRINYTGNIALDGNEELRVFRWARLRLPNGHTARSVWAEKFRKKQPRRARNVAVIIFNQFSSHSHF